ncbi:hypothetical protein PanWU01x14_045930 [Parasponia andersonii]|uniref:Uncharacterized protein n=1 Tax=Parasponia andersonii TaxID=3476 RepID=A0A2P5DPM6_PARAD|nr:hypothetical protein PanWU01x14_045930 [Parasponia andersonii]
MDGTGSRYAATLGTTTGGQRAYITLHGLARDNSRATTGSHNSCKSNVRGSTLSDKGTGGHQHGRCAGGRPLSMHGSHPRGDLARQASRTDCIRVASGIVPVLHNRGGSPQATRGSHLRGQWRLTRAAMRGSCLPSPRVGHTRGA